MRLESLFYKAFFLSFHLSLLKKNDLPYTIKRTKVKRQGERSFHNPSFSPSSLSHSKGIRTRVSLSIFYLKSFL